MPTYAYACTACGHAFDAVQKFSDAALTECPECGGRLRKVYTSIGVSFKGSGFYRNDSRASSNGSGKGAEKSSSGEKSVRSPARSRARSPARSRARSPARSREKSGEKSGDTSAAKSSDTSTAGSSTSSTGSSSSGSSSSSSTAAAR